MITLAMDTSHAVGSVALARDGELLATKQFREPSTHLVALGHAVDHVLAAAALTPPDINGIAVVLGPGSFTGLRIGLSFAKGLHAARGMTVVTIDALRLLALPWLAQGARVGSMIDARRGEVYAAVYERACDEIQAADPAAAHEIISPAALPPAALLASLSATPDVLVGTGALVHRDAILASFPSAVIVEGDAVYPSTAHLAEIAHRMHALDEPLVRTLEPVYLRASGAERMRLRNHARSAERGDD
jgi:tRNA threonylcarbamoyladenosine biosynthesis protein TsaB